MSARPALALLAPLKAEIEPILRGLGASHPLDAPAPARLFRIRGEVGTVIVGWTGMGRVATEAALRRLAELEPERVLHAGVAGGLAPDLRAGDALLLARAHHEDDLAPAPPDPALARALLAAGARDDAATLTVSAVVSTAAAKATLAARHPACAAGDKETFWAVRAAAELGLSLTCLRVICDRADEALPDLGPAIDPVGRPRPLALAARLARRPRDLLALPHVARAFATAQARLHQLLDRVARAALLGTEGFTR